MVTVRTVLTFVESKQWHIHQMDVYNAFLQGDLYDEIYMEPPQGFLSLERISINQYSDSLNILYELKQAPRQWNANLIEALLKLKLASMIIQSSYKSLNMDVH